MKKFYPFLLVAVFAFVSGPLIGQAILIDDNHSLSGFPFNNRIILGSDLDSTLWASDGTAAGTRQISPVKADKSGSAIFNNKIYFAGMNAAAGTELWSTDGTTTGTGLVSDIWPGPDSSKPDDFVVYLNKLYFTAFTPATGRELYEYTGSGTPSNISAINAGAGSSFDNPTYYILNNLLYFDATNGTTHALYSFNGMTITRVFDFPAGYKLTGYGAIGNTLFPLITNGSNGARIYKTTGGGGGATLVQAFTGPYSGMLTPQLINWNNKVLFTVAALGMDYELWITDGNTTQMVKDINPGPDGSFPLLYNSVVLKNKLVFAATTNDSGMELWTTDGTALGTSMLIDLNTSDGEGSEPMLWPVISLADDLAAAIDNMEVFKRDINFNGFIFFAATDGTNGKQLYKTDGTAAGTQLVKQINSGGDGVGDSYFYTKTGVVFSGNDGTGGFEPWISDGSAAGTHGIVDINPTGSSDPEFEFIWKGDIYLSADNGNGGGTLRDFYKLQGPYSPLPIVLNDLSATVLEHAVRLDWSTSSESNSDKFDVQRSTDGLHFTTIATVAAAGTSTLERNYNYMDMTAYSEQASVLYYRLNMRDKDGRAALTKVVTATLKLPAGKLNAFPNPVENTLHVRYQSATSGRLLVVDLNGRVLITRFVDASQTGMASLDVSHLAKGAYLLKLECDGGLVQSIKFLRK